jgi:hypothetical protein
MLSDLAGTAAALNLILLDIMADSYPGILLCEPKYAPDPGHEDRYEHPGPFYAVVCKEWRGVVTSKCVIFFCLSAIF